MTTLEHLLSLQPKAQGTITDYKYSPTGQYLAIADSQGYIQVYLKKDSKTYTKSSQFRADEGSIWSISWADTRYGHVIGIGSFRNKVAIWAEGNGSWKEIAYHQLHTASVNWVQFAQYGLKLYAGSSDGQLSILEFVNKGWKSQAFGVADAAVITFGLQLMPLGQIVDDENADRVYPRVVTATKDQKLKIWAHQCQKMYDQNPQKRQKPQNKSGYSLIREYPIPKQSIRSILLHQTFQPLSQSLSTMRVITCSEQGQLKYLKLSTASQSPVDKITTILSTESQIVRIGLSMTGNLLTAACVNKNQQEIVVFQNTEQDEWKILKKGKL